MKTKSKRMKFRFHEDADAVQYYCERKQPQRLWFFRGKPGLWSVKILLSSGERLYWEFSRKTKEV